jgi:hypothetical protein
MQAAMLRFNLVDAVGQELGAEEKMTFAKLADFDRSLVGYESRLYSWFRNPQDHEHTIVEGMRLGLGKLGGKSLIARQNKLTIYLWPL